MSQLTGLHKCRPANAPKVGQVKNFIVTEETSERGNQWTKIRNPDTKKFETGRPYNILEVKQLEGSDAHGNLSFNLLLEEINGERPQPGASVPMSQPKAVQTTQHQVEDPPYRRDTAQQHIMRSANLYNLCAATVNAVIYPEGKATEETWRAAVSSLFIEASGRRSEDNVHWWSWIDKMPSVPIEDEPF